VITRLWLRQFKAFEHCDIELRRLTVLLGENNSGKSSLLAALRLMAQTVQSQDQTVPLTLSGVFGDFGSYRDLVHGNHRGRPIKIGLVCTGRNSQTPEQSYFLETEFKYRMQRRETVLRSSQLGYVEGDRQRSLLHVTTSKDSQRLLVESVRGESIPEPARPTLSRGLKMFNFLPRGVLDFYTNESKSPDVNRGRLLIRDSSAQTTRAFNAILWNLRSVEYVGAMRLPPERTYVNSGVSGRKIGADGSGWPSVLALEPPRRRPVRAIIGKWMREAGIAESVSVSWLTDRHYEIVVTNPSTGETENIADVGQGTSQVLPVIVGAARLGRGDIFIVEEPEIHLHPRAQAALGDFFADLTGRGVQSLVETHSEYLLLRLQQKIASGELDPAAVVFYYVYSDRGAKTVTKLTLDENASFGDQLVGGFFPQRIEEARKLVQARGKRPTAT